MKTIPRLSPLTLLTILAISIHLSLFAQSPKETKKANPPSNPNAKAIIESNGPKSMKDADDEAIRKGKKKPYKQPPAKKS